MALSRLRRQMAGPLTLPTSTQAMTGPKRRYGSRPIPAWHQLRIIVGLYRRLRLKRRVAVADRMAVWFTIDDSNRRDRCVPEGR